MLLFCNKQNISFLKHFLMLLWCHLFAAPLGRLFALLIAAVVRGAKTLPPSRIPEHLHVTAVRIDMVDHLSIRLADTLCGARQTDGHRILLVVDTGIAQAVGGYFGPT